jgi:signal transduction histidine kinase
VTARGSLTVLWLVDSDPPGWVSSLCGRLGVVQTRTQPRCAAAAIPSAGVNGAVLAVVEDDDAVRRALVMGADDAVRYDELETGQFTRALERASARAEGRKQWQVRLVDLLRQDDALAVELLSSALGRRLIPPLVEAELDAKALLRGVSVNVSGDEDLRRKAEAVLGVLRHAVSVTTRLHGLVDSAHPARIHDLRELLDKLWQFLRPGVESVASFQLDLPDYACRVHIQHGLVTEVVTALVGNAVERMSRLGTQTALPDPLIALSLYVLERHAVIEVSDNGAQIAEEQAVSSPEPSPADTSAGLTLALARARVRRAGGELRLDANREGDVVLRVFFPLTTSMTPPPMLH